MGSPTSAVHKNVMEQEWHFILSVCSDIPSGEWLAGKAFWYVKIHLNKLILSRKNELELNYRL